MEVSGKTILIKKNYSTKDIAEATLKAYNENYMLVNDIAQKLKSNSVFETCKNIYNYLIENVQYVEDVNGQFVKTPGRLVNSGYGDCKSMSIFSASCLRCLNIDHVFRFVSFSDKKEATHVYVVAFDDDKEIIIDTGTRYPNFNKEPKNMTFTQDIKGPGLYYLSGIPSKSMNMVTALKLKPIWLNNENENEITQGKQFIYIKIDEFETLYENSKNNSDKKYYFKKLCEWIIILKAYNYVKGVTSDFKRISNIICLLSYKKSFDNISQNQNIGDKQLNEIFENLIHLYNEKGEITSFDINFFSYITENVISYNEKIRYSKTPKVSILNDLSENGYLFAYMFLSERKLNLEQKRIRNISVDAYNNILEVTKLKPEALKSILKTSFIKKFRVNPESLTSNNIKKIAPILILFNAVVTPLLIYAGKKLIDKWFNQNNNN